jgi:capsular polysaccharide biosynthesis protein
MVDLRYLINIILNRKWIIICVSIISALLAFLISRYLLPKQYTTSAYITLIEPIINAEFDSSIQVSPSMPDTQSLAELAQSDSIIVQVQDEIDHENYFENNRVEMEALLRGQNQILLTVIGEDPDIITKIANSWSEIVVQRLNLIYGSGDITVKEIELELDVAKKEWSAAQELFEEYLNKSNLESNKIEFKQLKASLEEYLRIIDMNQVIILDANGLDTRLAKKDQGETLTLGDALSLLTLHQRTVGEITGTVYHFELDTLIGDNYSNEDGRINIGYLITSLEEKSESIQKEIAEIEEEIIGLSVDIEIEKHRIEELTQERDLARTTYVALANQLQEIRITENQGSNTAKISSEAVKPSEPSSPSILINTFLGGFTGFLLSICGVVIFNWWNSPTKE